MADSKDKLLDAVTKGDLEAVKAMLKSFCLSSKAKKKSKMDYLTQQDKYNLFMGAVANKQLEIVEYFISSGLNFANNQHVKSSSMTTPLHVAIEKDNVEMLKLLLANGADVIAIDSEKRTPLILAAELNRTEAFKIILEQCENKKLNGTNVIDYQNNHGSALHEAIKNDNMEITKILLENDCHFQGFIEAIKFEKLSMIDYYIDHSPDSRERNIDDMLHLAISSGQINVVKYLLDTRAINLNKAAYNKKLPLETAIANSQRSMIDYLLERGADVKQAPVLTFAIKHKQTELLKMFLAMDTAESNLKSIKYKIPLLFVAAHFQHVKGVKILLSHGANVNETSSVNNTALHKAVSRKSIQIAKILLSRGASVNARREGRFLLEETTTPLHIAVKNGDLNMLELLLEYKADVTIVGHTMTPLDCAANFGCQKMVELLLNEGVFNGNSRRRVMSSAIYYAALDGNLELVKFFLKEGVALRTTEDITINESALHISAVVGYVEIFKLLLAETLAQGGSVDDCDNNLLTALHSVALTPFQGSAILQKPNNDPNDDKAREEIIDILLPKGADIHARGIHGMTPLHCSISNVFNTKIAVFLIRKGADFNMQDSYDRNVIDFICSGAPNRYLMGIGVNLEAQCITDHKIKLVKELIREIVLKVNIENVELSQKTLQSIQLNEEFIIFYNRCVKEAQKIKMEKFDKSNVTLADIIRTKNVNRLVAYTRNQSIVDYLASGYYRLKFIIYGQTIQDHFAPAILRRDLLDHLNIKDFFKFLPRENGTTLPNLPATFTKEVFAQLSYEDLENLKKTSRFVEI